MNAQRRTAGGTARDGAPRTPCGAGASCAGCRISGLCLPTALEGAELLQLEAIVRRRPPCGKDDYLYRRGDAFRSVFAVRSGSFKSLSADGPDRQRVSGFHLPGELVGLDGIGGGRHGCSLQALEHSSACEIPFDRLEALSRRLPGLQRRVFAILSEEIARDRRTRILLCGHTAEERVSAFLLGLSGRFARMALSPVRFLLPMSRGDISQYLGLALETVSRALADLKRRNLVAVSRREIRILDGEALRRIAEGLQEEPAP